MSRNEKKDSKAPEYGECVSICRACGAKSIIGMPYDMFLVIRDYTTIHDCDNECKGISAPAFWREI